MSNDFDRNDDFDFDDDDFNFDDDFGFDDDLDNGFDDDPLAGLDDDGFDDDPLGNLDDNEFGDEFDDEFDFEGAMGTDEDDLDFEDEDDEFDDEEPAAEGGGVSRTFLIIAAVFALFFLCGLLLIAGSLFGLLPGGSAQQTEVAFEETRIFRETENANRQTQIAASATAAVANQEATVAAEETATAQFTPATETPTPSPSPTEDLTATAEQEATNAAQETEAAAGDALANAQASETAFLLTLNPVTETPTSVSGGGEVSLPAVQQTATALAAVFNATPTVESAQPTSVVDVDVTPDIDLEPTAVTGNQTGNNTNNGQLPDTGLFDDVFQSNPAFIFLMVIGLFGVIVVSRGVRSANRREDD